MIAIEREENGSMRPLRQWIGLAAPLAVLGASGCPSDGGNNPPP
jgi:hypothetical protein